MTRLLTDAEMFSPAQPEKPAAAAPRATGYLTDTEMFGSSSDDIDRAAVEQKSAWGQTKAVAKDIAGYSAGVAGQLSDMVLAIPRVFSPLSWAGVAIGGRAAGVPRDELLGDMLKAQEEFIPEQVRGIYGKIAEAMGPEAKSYYDENGIGWFMHKFADAQDKITDAAASVGIPKDLATLVITQTMDVLGAKWVKESAIKGVAKRGAMEEARQSAKWEERQGAVLPEEKPIAESAPVTEPTKKDIKALRAAVKELDVSPEKLKEMFEKGEAPEAGIQAVKDIFDSVKRGERGGGKDPETFIHSMAALGVGTAAAIALYKYFIKEPPKEPVDEEREIGRGVRDKFFKDEQEKIWLEDQIKGKKPNVMASAEDKLWVSTEDIGAGLVGGAMLAGAVKGVGGEGVWTRNAIKEIANPIKNALIPEAVRLAQKEGAKLPQDAWVEQAVTKHLNEHFGAETDPLNPVKITTAGGETTWGQLADSVVKSAKIPERLRMIKEGTAEKGESVWDVEPGAAEKTGAQPLMELSGYLARVGTYLREFVPVEKLGEYDLVRAVKETAQHEIKQADLGGEIPRGPVDVGAGIDAVAWAKKNPELAKKVAAVGAGAAAGMALSNLYDPEHPLRDALYGALAGATFGTPGGRALLKRVVSSPDEAIGLISTRLGNIAPELKFALRRHESRVLGITDKLNDQVLPFLSALGGLSKDVLPVAKRALLNGDIRALAQIPELRATYPAVAKVLKGLEEQLQSLGRFQEGVANYFPRVVRDFEGLKKAIGQEASKGLEAMLVKAEAKSIVKNGRGLSELEQSIIVNRYLFSQDKSSFQPGYAKARKMDSVPENLVEFYEGPQESLLRYLSGAVNDIETARFFGRDLSTARSGKKQYTDVDRSVGNLTNRLIKEGKLTQPQAMEVRSMLKARFQGGEKGMSEPLAATRNLINASLLGNIASAATQVGDIATVFAYHGLVPTVQATIEMLRGKSRITPKDLGIVNHVAEELSEMGWTGRALHMTMKVSGFHAVDMLGKKLNMNAALIKNSRLVRSTKGEAEFRAKYESAFGEEIGQVIDDLKNRRMSENVELLAFNELSDFQPISKAELPQMYLEHPNGRILYQLKTYQLKQMDVVRREAYQEIVSGDARRMYKGAKRLMILGTGYALAGVAPDAIKDWVEGRDVDVLSTPKLVENALQTFGINRYVGERLKKGQVVGALQDMVTPPIRVLEDIVKLTEKSVSYIPIAGRSFYNRYLGGNERKEIAEKRYMNQGKTPAERERLSDEARDYLRERSAEKREKRREGR